MKQPVLTATLALIVALLSFIAGNNTGIQEGMRLTASYCIQHGRFDYARQQYACRKIETVTLKQYAKGN